MSLALIVDENMAVSRAIKDRLVPLGFKSSDQTWTESQAIAAANTRQPDIVVMGNAISSGSPVVAAQHIAAQFGSPILLVTAGHCEVRRQLPKGGPFSLSEIKIAADLAGRSNT
jgi:hypothetical protein